MNYITIKDETLTIEKAYDKFTSQDFLKILAMVTNNFYLDDNQEVFYINENRTTSFPDFVNGLTTLID